MNIYRIYDSKACAYTDLIVSQNHATATRAFKKGINDPKSPYFHSPEDFVLFHVGSYEPTKSAIVAELPKAISDAIELKEYGDGN